MLAPADPRNSNLVDLNQPGAMRIMAAPVAIATAPPQPRRPGRSPRNVRASTTPNRIPVSRSAATGATGACVIAHSTSAYAVMLAAAPPSPRTTSYALGQAGGAARCSQINVGAAASGNSQ